MIGLGDPTSAILQQQFFNPRDAPLTAAERKGARFRQVQTLRGTTAPYDPRGNALRGWARAGHSLGLARRSQRAGGVLPPTHPFAKTYTGTPHRVKNLRHLGQPLSQVKTAEKETQTQPPPLTTPGRSAPPPPQPSHHIDKPGFDWQGHALSAASDILGPVVKEKIGKIGGNLIDAILKPDPVVPSELQMTDMADLVDGHGDQTVPITWWQTGSSSSSSPSSGHYPLVPPESSPAVVYPSVPPHQPPAAGQSSLPTPSPSPPPAATHSIGTQAEPAANAVDAATQAIAHHHTSAHTQTESRFGPHELDLIFAHPHAFEHMIARIDLAHTEAQQLRTQLENQYRTEHQALYGHARQALRHAFAVAGIDPGSMPDTLTNEQAIAIIADAVPDMARELIELRQRAHTARLHEIHVNEASTQTVSRPNPLLRHLRSVPADKHERWQYEDDDPPPPGRRARTDQRRLPPPPRIRTTDLPRRFNYRQLDENVNAPYRPLSAAQAALTRANRELLADNAAQQMPLLHPRTSRSINGAWVYPLAPRRGKKRPTRPLEHIDDV